jgi:actin-like ATPase involved in cell morphogenesis
VIAVGNEAHKMQGREARDVTVIAPLVDGVVADFERTRRCSTTSSEQRAAVCRISAAARS